MKKSLHALLFILLPGAILAQSGKYTLTGHIGNANAPGIAYLLYSSEGNYIQDSTVPSNGTFVFKGTLDHPIKGTLMIKHWSSEAHPSSYADKIQIYLEKGHITLTSPDSLINATFTGSSLNKDLRDLQTALKPTNSQDERKAIFKQFIQQHPSSEVSLFALKSYAGVVPDYATTYPLFNSLSQKVKNSYDGKHYADQLDKVKATSIGATAPDFTENDVNGQPVKLSALRGKYVLVDFWASWCGPCRAENPNVVKLYDQYKDKNFTVLGVSLDQPNGREKWIKAIADDHLEWTQVSDLAFWKNKAAELYGVKAIPQNFLLDPNGKIIGKDLRGEALANKLASIL